MEITELKREFDELKDVGEKQELRVRYLETRAYNTAMAYLIWERFLVAFATSNSNSNSLNYYCSHWWMLLGFNLSSTFLYLLFFLEAVIMLYRAQNHLDIIFHSLDQISQQLTILNQVTSPDPDHHHHPHLQSGDSVSSIAFDFSFRVQPLYRYRPYGTIRNRKLYFASILCALLALTAFQLCITFSYSLCN